jgi:hypothetical protein
LAEARERRYAARKLSGAGHDPSAQRQAGKRRTQHQTENSFEAVAREWYEKQSNIWVPQRASHVLRRLEASLFPDLATRPIAEITAPELLAAVRKIEKRGRTISPTAYHRSLLKYSVTVLQPGAASVTLRPIFAVVDVGAPPQPGDRQALTLLLRVAHQLHQPRFRLVELRIQVLYKRLLGRITLDRIGSRNAFRTLVSSQPGSGLSAPPPDLTRRSRWSYINGERVRPAALARYCKIA